MNPIKNNLTRYFLVFGSCLVLFHCLHDSDSPEERIDTVFVTDTFTDTVTDTITDTLTDTITDTIIDTIMDTTEVNMIEPNMVNFLIVVEDGQGANVDTVNIKDFDPQGELIPVDTIKITARFVELEHNPLWYRSFDTSSLFTEVRGELLFSWFLEDDIGVPDSFYIGIDTLWHLPPEWYDTEENKWDLQVCPNEVCIQGVNINIFGGNASRPFDDDLGYHGEHHFQFLPAINPDPAANYGYTAPEGTIVGGMMYANSRTSGLGDTVFAFGAWQMPWDEDFLPPVKPVDGYLPVQADFEIVDGKVRYIGP